MAEASEGEAGRGAVTVDQLIALNDEIRALTRAGVPLGRGLRELGDDLPGRLGRLATGLGQRLDRGESLSDALEGLGDGLPGVYRAVVEAGLRSGRLPTALEGLATYARGYAEARRSIGLALWYPFIVLVLAYALFLFLVARVIPRLSEALIDLGLRPSASTAWLVAVGDHAWYWGPVVPVGLLAFLVAWAGSGRAFRLGGGRAIGVLRWFPWVGPMMRAFEAAGFADLLALLVEHRVPYPDALRLAGEASGDPDLARSSRELAEAVTRGLPPGEALRGRSAFPPILRWLLATGPRQADLVAALRQMAGRYRGQARFRADKIRVLLPTILLFGIGFSATLLYALALFVPLTSLWTSLSLPAR